MGKLVGMEIEIISLEW